MQRPDAIQPRLSDRSEVLGWVKLAAVLVVMVLVPVLLMHLRNTDESPGNAIRRFRQDTRFFFIGNSITETRIDPRTIISTHNGGVSVVLQNPSSQPALWYLRLKNEVVASGINPEAVVFFFRNDELTEEHRRSAPRYERQYLAYSTETEPDFDAVVANSRSLAERAEDVVDVMFPGRPETRVAVEEYLKLVGAGSAETAETLLDLSGLETGNQLGFFSLRKESDIVAGLTNETFREQLSRQLQADQLGIGGNPSGPVKPRSVDFSTEASRSFLPLILAQGTANDIPLVFVRIKHRPELDGSQPPGTVTGDYFTDLRLMIEDSGHRYADMTNVSGLTRDMYYDKDHIASESKTDYTKLILLLMTDVFTDPDLNR